MRTNFLGVLVLNMGMDGHSGPGSRIKDNRKVESFKRIGARTYNGSWEVVYLMLTASTEPE
jgi:hypothetical protein